MFPKLHALICVYNAEETIIDCLKSAVKYFDVVHVLEGKWIGYQGYGLHSYDRTIPRIEYFWHEHPDLLYAQTSQALHQYQARNLLLDAVPVDDWFWFLDSDEVVLKMPDDIHEILAECRKYNIRGFRITYKQEHDDSLIRAFYPRILLKVDGMHMSTNHRFYTDAADRRISFKGRDFRYLPDVVYEHRGGAKVQRMASNLYARWLLQWEVTTEGRGTLRRG